WIEDVVVDENARGKGVAASLVYHALKVAREKGIEKVDLTSTPARVAANRLYQKLGFRKRETNVYRFTF
ncbi:MAG TPA: GNAT family N-acetyltransferase, partial [Porphyromonadaceae bacterium]|nr:GNAT family N-acetyltransferase [Porphyromonadaceae bacterium]